MGPAATSAPSATDGRSHACRNSSPGGGNAGRETRNLRNRNQQLVSWFADIPPVTAKPKSRTPNWTIGAFCTATSLPLTKARNRRLARGSRALGITRIDHVKGLMSMHGPELRCIGHTRSRRQNRVGRLAYGVTNFCGAACEGRRPTLGVALLAWACFTTLASASLATKVVVGAAAGFLCQARIRLRRRGRLRWRESARPVGVAAEVAQQGRGRVVGFLAG
jgi:hypothetical protein